MKLRYIHTLCLSLLYILCHSQVLSSKGRFSVEFDRGCAPMTVNITELDTFGNITRQYYYFEGATITNDKTFTYQAPGNYQIVQVIGQDGVEKSDTLFVEALEAFKPEISIRRCNGLEVSVTSADNYYDSVRIYFTSMDSITLLAGETGTYIYTTNSPQTLGIKGLFHNADEVCTTYTEEVVPIPALSLPQITQAVVKETCKDVFSLYLSLSGFDTLTQYRVYITQNNNSTLVYDDLISKPDIISSGIPFDRQADYCINIASYDPCNGTVLPGTDFCAETSELSLSPFSSLYSTYDSSGIYIHLDEVAQGAFQVYRRLDEEPLEFRGDHTSAFRDRTGSLARRYYYKIDYTDSCGQVLFSAETHPPLVSAERIGTNQYQVSFIPPLNSLSGNPTHQYQVGGDISQTSGDIVDFDFTVQLNAKDGSPKQLIRATSTYNESGITLQSNSITIRHELVLYVPKAFTPNGDGLNDTLQIFGLPTANATVEIFNRWGQLVYSSDKPSPGWDGTINGTLAAEGTYLYKITFETPEGNKQTQRGTFALIKK